LEGLGQYVQVLTCQVFTVWGLKCSLVYGIDGSVVCYMDDKESPIFGGISNKQ